MNKALRIAVLAVMVGGAITTGGLAARGLLHRQLAVSPVQASDQSRSLNSPIAYSKSAPVNKPIELRFAAAIDPKSLTPDSIALLGPQGKVEVSLHLAKGATVANVTPAQDLLPDSFYALYVRDVRKASGEKLAPEALSFHTLTIESDNAASNIVPAGWTHILERLSQGSAISDVTPSTAGESYHLRRQVSFVKDGAWYPGDNNLDGRWRLNTKVPALAHADELSQKIPAQTTALFGQVLRIDDLPVANVEVAIGEQTARTDAQGRFLLTGIPAGRQELYVDGTTAGKQRGGTYGQFVVGVDIKDHRINELPYQLFIPKVRTQDRIAISSPTTEQVILRHPEIPGLEIHIPAGTVIRDHKGHNLTELSLVPTPVDRAPYPVPVNFPVYFTLQPGGAGILGLTPESAKGVRVVYPNYAHAGTGAQHSFLFYDPARGWRNYGMGEISADRKQVVPGEQVSLYAQVGASYVIDTSPPPAPRPPPDCSSGCGEGGAARSGDPVDLATGLFSHQRTDFAIDDVMPILLTRTYRNGDGTTVRPFGLGTTHNFGMYLYNPNNDYKTPQLILPDGSGVTFTRQSGSRSTGTWVNTGSNSRYYGALLTTDGGFHQYFITLKDGGQLQFNYSTPNYLTAMRDRYGNSLTFVYTAGLLSQVRSQSGRHIDFSYDGSNRISQIADHTGRTVQYSYNAAGMLDTATYPDGTNEHYTYDSSKRMLSVQDRRGNTMVTNQYDTNSRVIAQTLADGSQYIFNYTVENPVIGGALGTNYVKYGFPIVAKAEVTDPRGKVRHVEYDHLGVEVGHSFYPLTETDAYGTPQAQTYTYERNAAGQIMARTDALGRRTENSYDAKGNLTQVKLLAGTANAVTYQYTYTPDYSQLATVTDPLNHTTTLSYTNGCLTQIKDALNHSTTLTCNGFGQTTSIKDALNHTTQLIYDGYDLYSVIDPLNRTKTYYRDSLGRVIATVDPLGNRNLATYDVNDRVSSSTDPNGATTQYHYDGNGNLTSRIDPTGNAITWSYDARNRNSVRTDQLVKTQNWTYDGLGNVLTYKDRKNQQLTLSYDAMGRLAQRTHADSTTIQYSYDTGNRLTQIVDSASGTITRSYDGLDRLTQEQTAQGTVSYAYDTASRRTSQQVGATTATTYGYDTGNRLTQMLHGGETVGITYDDANRRATLVLPNNVTTSYGYDNANQLLSLGYSRGANNLGGLTYGYDVAGRKTSTTGSFASDELPAQTTSNYQYNAGNQLTGGNAFTPSYDANGDMTADGKGNAYTWNARRQLTRIDQGVMVVASFKYDAMGRRVSKIVGSAAEVKYLYDGSDPVQEKQGATTTNLLTGLGTDERFARDDTGGRSYFLTDALSSTIALTDTNGAIQQRYSYDPYGKVKLSNPASTLTNPYQYTGRENDGTGLNFYRARYYSPTLHRFISEDPIQLVGGPNGYAYVGGNPILLSDPSGLLCVSERAKSAISAGVGAAVGAAASGTPVVAALGVGVFSGALDYGAGSQIGGAFAGGALGLAAGRTEGAALAGAIGGLIGAGGSVGAVTGGVVGALSSTTGGSTRYSAVAGPVLRGLKGGFFGAAASAAVEAAIDGINASDGSCNCGA